MVTESVFEAYTGQPLYNFAVILCISSRPYTGRIDSALE